MKMVDYIAEYIASHSPAWSATTQRGERARLNAVLVDPSGSSPMDKTPEEMWGHLLAVGMAPYSRLTTWVRLSHFYDWLLAKGYRTGVNGFKAFRQANPKFFKNVYVKKHPKINLRTAKLLIGQLQEPYRQIASFMLLTGCRFSEVATYKDGFVLGKGNKQRRVYNVDTAVEVNVSHWDFWKALSQVGLKPHDLRKISLSELVRNDINAFELKAVAGWSSLQTAESYIAVNEEKISKRMEALK